MSKHQLEIDQAFARLRSGEPCQDFELDAALALNLDNTDTLSLPAGLSHQKNSLILSKVFEGYQADEEKKKQFPQIAMPFKLESGRYAGLLIRGKNAIWIDPAGENTMPEYLVDSLRKNLGIEQSDIVVSRSKYQPTFRDESGRLIESDKNSALLSASLLTSLARAELGLEMDESTKQVKLCYKDSEGESVFIPELTTEESAAEEKKLREATLREFGDYFSSSQAEVRQGEETKKAERRPKKNKSDPHPRSSGGGFSFVNLLRFVTFSSLVGLGMGANATSNAVTLRSGGLRPRAIDERPSPFPSSAPSNLPTSLPTGFPSALPPFDNSSAPSLAPTFIPTNSSELSGGGHSVSRFPKEVPAGLGGFALSAIVEGFAGLNYARDKIYEIKEGIAPLMGESLATGLAPVALFGASAGIGSGLGALGAAIADAAEGVDDDQSARIKDWAFLGGLAGMIAASTGLVSAAISKCTEENRFRVAPTR